MLEQAPLPRIIEDLARSIAEAQMSMDRVMMDALQVLADSKVTVPGSKGSGVEKSMLELGFFPSFYHFAEANINVRMAFTSMEGEEFGIGASISGGKPGIFAASLSASYTNKYSFSADAASEINTKIVSVPAPALLTELMAKLSGK